MKRKYEISFESVSRNLIDIICATILMVLVLVVVKAIIPLYSSVRIINLLIIIVYAIIGIVVYFVYAHFTGLINKVFGKGVLRTVKKIIIRK